MLLINQNELLLGRKHCHFNSFICRVEIIIAFKCEFKCVARLSPAGKFAVRRLCVFVKRFSVGNDSRSVFYFTLISLFIWIFYFSHVYAKKLLKVALSGIPANMPTVILLFISDFFLNKKRIKSSVAADSFSLFPLSFNSAHP